MSSLTKLLKHQRHWVKHPQPNLTTNLRIVTSRQVAERLEWNPDGHLLNLLIPSDGRHLELAVGCHPELRHGPHNSNNKTTTIRLPNIPLFHNHNQKKEKSMGTTIQPMATTSESLNDILQRYDICGWVVEWPLTPHGTCGAQCGKVLHTLEAISKHIDGAMMLCLHPVVSRLHLRSQNHQQQQQEDEWGRSPIYGSPPSTSKTVHVASLEQYKRTYSPCVVRDVWRTYSLLHWPNASSRIPMHDETDSSMWTTNDIDDSTFLPAESKVITMDPSHSTAPTAMMKGRTELWKYSCKTLPQKQHEHHQRKISNLLHFVP
jgi:hypothetical protein